MKRLTFASTGLALTMAMLLAALFVSGVFGGSDEAPSEGVSRDVPAAPAGRDGASAASERVPDATEGGDSAGEGIAVHGNWRVAIYNADGTLAEEYVFQNALRPQGGDALGRILSSQEWAAETGETDGTWTVVFGERDSLDLGGGGLIPGIGPCSTDISDATLNLSIVGAVAGRDLFLSTGCALWWPDVSSVLPTLTSGVLNPPEAIADGVRVSGSVEATQDGSIDYVETWLVFSEPPPVAGGLPTLEGFAFTGTGVGPFDAQAGQTIEMEVEITFETAP
jgi:hypothetical protein